MRSRWTGSCFETRKLQLPGSDGEFGGEDDTGDRGKDREIFKKTEATVPDIEEQTCEKKDEGAHLYHDAESDADVRSE